jgi:hypothetical protein
VGEEHHDLGASAPMVNSLPSQSALETVGATNPTVGSPAFVLDRREASPSR